MVRFIDKPPTEVVELPTADGPDLTGADVERIAEIFNTPLTGSYCWDYQEVDQRIRKLYRLGKERNWNVDADLDWGPTHPRSEAPVQGTVDNPYEDSAPFAALTEEERLLFGWHHYAWTLSQFMHGEQGALLVASQLVSCAPTHEAKLYAASQTFDEARHVEVFSRYIRDKVHIVYPVNRNLKVLLDKILTDPRWDLKFIGMQLIIEALALAAFAVQKEVAADPLLKDILEYVTRDEARHVAFGVNYMEQFVKSLSPQEVQDRALFAYEACRVMRERIVPTDVYEHYGWDAAEGRERFLRAGDLALFRNLLLTRIMPNLKRVGLLTEEVMPLYDELGLLELSDLPSDVDINWDALSAPLPKRSADLATA